MSTVSELGDVYDCSEYRNDYDAWLTACGFVDDKRFSDWVAQRRGGDGGWLIITKKWVQAVFEVVMPMHYISARDLHEYTVERCKGDALLPMLKDTLEIVAADRDLCLALETVWFLYPCKEPTVGDNINLLDRERDARRVKLAGLMRVEVPRFYTVSDV